MPITTTDFLVKKNAIQQVKFAEGKLYPASLAPGQLLFRIDKVAFTANNITYALLGDNFQYWQFFPAAEAEWGKIPAWGFAEVSHSNHSDVAVGERLYGYFPLATHLVVEPAHVAPGSFYDGATHRQALSPIYNQYIRVERDPGYSQEFEAWQALFRPLFTTSFLLDDFLATNGFFGAETVIISSASSKTAYGLAFLLNKNKSERNPYEIIGLTSAANAPFVEQLGCYDSVVTYDQITALDNQNGVVFVDIAGNAEVRSQLHHHYGANVAYSCSVGAAHWEDIGSGRDLPGAEPKVFFAPSQAQKRIGDWGAAEFQGRLGRAWQLFLEPLQNQVTIIESRGTDAVEQCYHAFLAGHTEPDKGYILSL